MSEPDLSERILHALIQNPWASTSDLTQVLSAPRLDVLSTCQALAAAGKPYQLLNVKVQLLRPRRISDREFDRLHILGQVEHERPRD